MKTIDILRARLHNQRLLGEKFASAAEAVRWLGAVQSQDFGGAMWAVGQRVEGVTAASFAEAFAQGEVLRTHVLRPTWHFVMPEDIRWMIELSRQRLLRMSAPYYKKLELDEQLLVRSDAIIQRALEDGKHLTRAQLAATLAEKGIDTQDGVRLGFIVGHAEFTGLICSGEPAGKQQTYALIAERAPGGLELAREAAVAELAARYFASHGPATLEDFAWWAGLTKTEAGAGLHAIASSLQQEQIDGAQYWFALPGGGNTAARPKAFLLPNYDEYIVAYADRAALFDTRHLQKLDSRQNPLFNNVLILNNVIAGTWKKTERRTSLTLDISAFQALSQTDRAAVQQAAEQYASFLQLGDPMVQITSAD